MGGEQPTWDSICLMPSTVGSAEPYTCCSPHHHACIKPQRTTAMRTCTRMGWQYTSFWARNAGGWHVCFSSHARFLTRQHAAGAFTKLTIDAYPASASAASMSPMSSCRSRAHPHTPEIGGTRYDGGQLGGLAPRKVVLLQDGVGTQHCSTPGGHQHSRGILGCLLLRLSTHSLAHHLPGMRRAAVQVQLGRYCCRLAACP